jgi:hypothetical protein
MVRTVRLLRPVGIVDGDPRSDRLVKRELLDSQPADEASEAIALISFVNSARESLIYRDTVLPALAGGRGHIIRLQQVVDASAQKSAGA